MIYMVDHVYADPATEAQWHAWYSEYLKQLVAVPGIHSAQRFYLDVAGIIDFAKPTNRDDRLSIHRRALR